MFMKLQKVWEPLLTPSVSQSVSRVFQFDYTLNVELINFHFIAFRRGLPAQTHARASGWNSDVCLVKNDMRFTLLDIWVSSREVF